MYLTYILKTGALWKGNIGKATIIMKDLGINFDILKKYGAIYPSIEPKGYKIENGNIIWKLYDFEPEQDINVYWNASYYSSLENGIQMLKKEYISDDEIAEFLYPIDSHYYFGDKVLSQIALKLVNRTTKNFPKYKYLIGIYNVLEDYKAVSDICYRYFNKVEKGELKYNSLFTLKIAEDLSEKYLVM